MSFSLQRFGVCAAYGLAGAIFGGMVVTALLPILRHIDPLGLSPIVLISVIGGGALGWYLRGRI
jgi:hypothetical protein